MIATAAFIAQASAENRINWSRPSERQRFDQCYKANLREFS
jgi:hypothetical protein